jgi:zinc/manganese transport system substrate-binding protein
MRKLLCLLGICLAAGCSKQEGGGPSVDSAAPAAAPGKKLVVVATIAPMYCFTKNVAGDLADVEMIVPPGAPARGFVPTDDQVRQVMAADVIVENGFGFEDWMDKLDARGLKDGAIRVIAARGTGPGIPGLPGDPNTPPGPPPDLTGTADGSSAADSGPPDPHVWLDPVMAIKEVQNIRDALMARDPGNANAYLANENQYESKLRDLDDQVGRTTVEITRRRLLCADDTFTYFLSRYEFPVVKKVESASGVLIARGTDPGALGATGLPVITLDPMESGTASVDFYEKETLGNAQALREGLMR